MSQIEINLQLLLHGFTYCCQCKTRRTRRKVWSSLNHCIFLFHSIWPTTRQGFIAGSERILQCLQSAHILTRQVANLAYLDVPQFPYYNLQGTYTILAKQMVIFFPALLGLEGSRSGNHIGISAQFIMRKFWADDCGETVSHPILPSSLSNHTAEQKTSDLLLCS